MVEEPCVDWLVKSLISLHCELNFFLQDGGVNPPRFYHTHEEIDNTLRANGISPRARLEQQAAQMSRISPTPVPSAPGPLSYDLVNFPQNNAAGVPAGTFFSSRVMF